VRYVRHRPARPLDEFVEYLWALSDSPGHSLERIVPSGTLELVINLAEDEIRVYRPGEPVHPRRYPGSVVSGAFAGCFLIDTREHASIMGVHFRPGGAFPFLGSPADQLADRHVALEDLWTAGEVTRLRDRLCTAAGVERFLVLEEALLARLRWPRESERAALLALSGMGAGASVADVASRVGLSHRRFIQIFGRVVGMTPKVYLRVERFQRLLALADHMIAPRWAQLAQRCGYFDQSHLIRDFRAFAGLTPAQYGRQRGGRVKDHHVAVDREGSNLSKTGAQAAPILE
jgi:AraC-like DNA-binding protein